MYKKITLFALLVSVIGFILEFYTNYDSILFYVLSYFNYNIATGAEILWVEGNTLRLFFNIILFIGVIAYYFSKGRETRFLRFTFSVLFVEQCFFILLRVYGIIVGLKFFTLKDILLSLLSLAIASFVIYFLYKSMKYLNEQKVLDYQTFVYTEYSEIAYFKTSNWQRLFHYIIDTVIFGIIGFQFLDYLIRIEFFHVFFREIENEFSPRIIFWTLVIIFRTVFYFIFEALFGATPGKFLTESRVVNDDGLKVGNSMLFKRSIWRSVPLNGVSFLFNADWHDTYSDSQVFKEKRTGIKGGWYFLLIPISIVLYGSGTVWEGIKERNRFLEHEKMVFDEKKADLLYSLKTLDTNSVLQFNTTGEASNTLYLKAEKISNAEIEFSILKLNNFGSKTPSLIEKVYPRSKDSLERIIIKKADLFKLMLNKEFDQDQNVVRREDFEGIKNVPLLQNQYIEDIYQIFAPQLSIRYVSKSSELLYFEINNEGLPASIVAVESANKGLDWDKNELPLNLPRNLSGQLRFINKDVEDYKIKIIVNDSLNKKYKYEISPFGENYAKIKMVR